MAYFVFIALDTVSLRYIVTVRVEVDLGFGVREFNTHVVHEGGDWESEESRCDGLEVDVGEDVRRGRARRC